MVNTDYQIEAIQELLNEDCILTRYYPLIPYKLLLIKYFKAMGCRVKSDCLKLSDEALMSAGLPNIEEVNLFRGFLTMYDVNPRKFKEIDSVSRTPEEVEAFKQIYHLPGVKSTRANLYYKSGFTSLDAIASSTPEEIRKRTEELIEKEKLNLKVPLMKEIKTHIAVAKAFINQLNLNYS